MALRGVILAGGRGTRLSPLTKVTNKHLLPVGREPMIFNPIKQLVSAKIRDILIVTSTEHMGDIVNLLGSGHDFGSEFTYRVQERSMRIAHALSLAEGFAQGDRIVVILADNICDTSIAPYVRGFEEQAEGARLLLKRVDDPNRFGIAAMDEKKIIEIEEKPEYPKTDFAVIGYYMYDNRVFDFIRFIKPSDRGELEITPVNNMYIEQGLMEYDILEGNWTDAGTFESWLNANQIMLNSNNELK